MKHTTLLAASLAVAVTCAAHAQTPPTKPTKPPKAGQEPGKATPKQAAKPAQAIRAIRLTAGGMGAAKPPTQEELIERRDKKLAEAWVGKAAWITDYDAARKAAAAADKKLFAYFTRSYAP